jgi:hypothetical protein
MKKGSQLAALFYVTCSVLNPVTNRKPALYFARPTIFSTA